MAKPTLSVFSGSESLGIIFSESVQLNNKFWEGNIPLTNDSGAYAVSYAKTKLITLQGVTDGEGFTGATIDVKLRDFVETIETWINAVGTQSAETYTTSIGIAYAVKCLDFTWRRSFNDPNRLLYSFVFKRV